MTALLPIMLSLTTNAAIAVPLVTYGEMLDAGVQISIAQPMPRPEAARGTSRRSTGRRRSVAVARAKPMFRCEKCGKEFEYVPTIAPHGRDDMPPPPDAMGMTKPDCPECGAKKSGQPLTLCVNPDCGKYYVSPRFIWTEALLSDRNGSVSRRPPKEICPHCQTDQTEWRKKNRRRRRRR